MHIQPNHSSHTTLLISSANTLRQETHIDTSVWVNAMFDTGLGQKRQLIKDYTAMIANNRDLIHCVALSHRFLSLLIRGLTSTFAADEGASPLLNLNIAYQTETAH